MNDMRLNMRRAVPFVMAMLLATLMPLSAQALFGGKGETAVPGAPVAQDMEIRAYRGVAYTGTLKAVDNEGGILAFQMVDAPEKGTLELGEEGVFVYTPDRNRAGTDRFTFTATDEDGNVSREAVVKIRISRVSSGVSYSDTDGKTCATAAVDLAEHSVFVGSKVGGDWFFEPERTVSRGEFVSMAMAAAGLAPSEVTVTGFCDDDEIPAWMKGSAAGAVAAGLVCGVPTEAGIAFDAERAVTLSEAAEVLNRVLRVTDVDPSAFDGGEAVWYAQAVANLESVSIAPVGGYETEALSRGVTRGEAAELLSAAMALAEARAENESFWSRVF
ncbi:MAG: surface layer protein [Ruminococcaceae bacterium]|nr:surface layer protein [Oscillospiraceae bacterium]